MNWTNDSIFEFLSLYTNEPALWNTKSAEHKNRNDQQDAWNRIQSKLKDGNVPIKEIRKKRDNLMSTYRKLRSRIKRSINTSSSGDEIFKPDWPFYNFMSTFLDDVYNPKNPKNSEDTVCKEEETEENGNQNDNVGNDEKKENNAEDEKSFKKSKNLPKRSKENEIERRMDEAYNYLKQMTQKPQDECSLYTELLCKKLRRLQEKTREIAMLEIDKLVFHLKQNEMQSSYH